MKTVKYTSEMNGITVFVKGYSTSLRIHVETPNASISPYQPANYSESQVFFQVKISWSE